MRVEIKNQDKPLFSAPEITKGELIGYYTEMAELFLRHAKDRPLSFLRCPDGIDDCFFQKNRGSHYPDWLESAVLPGDEHNTRYVIVQRQTDLRYLANQACIEMHMGLTKKGDIERPDQVVFDLDPGPGMTFSDVKNAALSVGKRCRAQGLVPFVKTTGSKGLHVVTPIRSGPSHDATRAWGRSVATQLARESPDRFTTNVRKDNRQDKIFVDVARNALGQTIVAPYSVRARPNAPIAMPVHWDELSSLQSSDAFTVRQLLDKKRPDAWNGMGRHRRNLPDLSQ